MSCGQLTSPLRWLPELSSTTPIGPSPNSWRRCCRKISRHCPSTVGNKRKTPVPVVGSTAAYSQSHSYSSCTIQGGRAPNGHQRRRSQVIRPKRPSSKATTRCSGGCFSRLPKFFLKQPVARPLLFGFVCAPPSPLPHPSCKATQRTFPSFLHSPHPPPRHPPPLSS